MAMREEVPGRPWAMEVNGPVVELDTIYGPVTATFTSPDHAAVYIGYTEFGRRPEDGGPAFTYRGKEYQGYTHVWGLDGNPCQFDNQGREPVCSSTDGAHTHRGWMHFRRVGGGAAPTYQDDMAATMRATVNDFIDEHPEVLAVAARVNAQAAREHADSEQAEAESAFRAAQDKLISAAGNHTAARTAEAQALAAADQRAAQRDGIEAGA
jgi:hypothetical protein